MTLDRKLAAQLRNVLRDARRVDYYISASNEADRMAVGAWLHANCPHDPLQRPGNYTYCPYCGAARLT